MKTPADNYIVRFPKERKVGSIILPSALGLEAGEFAREIGEVIGLPMKFTNKANIPCSDLGRPMTMKDIAKFCKFIELGSTVFCHYLATDEDRLLPMNDDEYDYFWVPAHLIIAVIEGDTLFGAAGKVIIEPLKKELSKVILGEKIKDAGLGTIAFESPYVPWRRGLRVMYLERLAYPIKYNGKEYDIVYYPEVYGSIS